MGRDISGQHAMSRTPSSSAAIIPFQPKPKRGFVKLDYTLLDSPEWQSLPAVARAVYVDLARKHTGFNNGQIPYSARECANRLHIVKDTAWRALRVLEWRGLIRCTSRGSCNVKTRDAKTSYWELPQYPLVRLEGPAGPIRGTSNDIPGPIRGTFNRFRNIDLRYEKRDFRRRRKDPKKEKERAQASATLERYRRAAETNGGGE